MFTKFRDLKTKEQQSSSMELAEHAKNVMSTLDEGFKSLDDMDAFLAYLHEVGASHTKIPGFNRMYFWVSCAVWIFYHRINFSPAEKMSGELRMIFNGNLDKSFEISIVKK